MGCCRCEKKPPHCVLLKRFFSKTLQNSSEKALQNSSETMCLDFILAYSLQLYLKRDSETGLFLLIFKENVCALYLPSKQLLLKRLKTQVLKSLTRAFHFYMSRFNLYFEKFLIFSS